MKNKNYGNTGQRTATPRCRGQTYTQSQKIDFGQHGNTFYSKCKKRRITCTMKNKKVIHLPTNEWYYIKYEYDKDYVPHIVAEQPGENGKTIDKPRSHFRDLPDDF